MATLLRGHACFLCGVAFDIARIRTIHEPAELNIRPRLHPEFHGLAWWKWAGGCGRDSGCMSIFSYEEVYNDCTRQRRDPESGKYYVVRPISKEEENVIGSGLLEDSLDYASLGPSASEYIRVVTTDRGPEKSLHIGSYEYWEENNMQSILRARLEEHGFIFAYKEGHRPSFPFGSFDHIAGPGCLAHGRDYGYSGHRISYQEMSRSTFAQAIYLWPGPQEGQEHLRLADDEDWENESNAQWRLTGLQHFSADIPRPSVPPRYRPGVLFTCDTSEYTPIRREMAMQFHPACLEVFRRAAIRRNGSFNINKLGNWFVATSGFTLSRFPRNAAVKRGMSYEWYHHIGDEWLGADPCHIKDLVEVFADQIDKSSSSIASKRLNVDWCGSLMDDTGDNGRKCDSISLFPPNLPVDCLHLVFDRLPIDSVSNVAIAFPHLTTIVYWYLRGRVKMKWPFLWELWSQEPYSKWTSMNMLSIGNVYRQAYTEAYGSQPPSWNVESPMIDVNDGMNRHLRFNEICKELGFVAQPAVFLDPDECTQSAFIRIIGTIQRLMQEDRLKGMRNRQRIWQDCELILDQIEMLENHKGADWNAFSMAVSRQCRRTISDDLEALLYGDVTLKEWDRLDPDIRAIILANISQ